MKIVILIVAGIVVFLTLIWLAILWEKHYYNNGICKYCKQPLRYFGTDSQGSRLYTCVNFCIPVSVSYNCVDMKR